MSSLPTAFVSHGSPLLALKTGRTGAAWHRLAAELPRPASILMISAHWDGPRPAVSAAAKPQTIHDFYGFPEPLYRIEYPAPGAPALARRVHDLLAAAGFTAEIDSERGLDHGAWVPLREMYPGADIPVTQLSVQSRLGPEHHYRLGLALSALPGEDVLVIGSGSLTHNLREVISLMGVEDAPDLTAYVGAFQDWMHDRLVARDFEALLDYRRRAPEAARAHPTEEHLVPLYVAYGAAGNAPQTVRHHAGITEGVLAMDVYTFAPTAGKVTAAPGNSPQEAIR